MNSASRTARCGGERWKGIWVSDLFIIDNGDRSWKAKNYLHEWADLVYTFDIAMGYFEIGALLTLDGQCQKLDRLRTTPFQPRLAYELEEKLNGRGSSATT